MRQSLLAIALLGVMLAGLGLLMQPSGVLRFAAWGFVVVVVGAAISLRRLGLRETYLLGLVAALSGLVMLWHGDRAEVVLAGAMDQAAYLMCFIIALGLLNEAAARSPSVATCGIYLTRQPPGRRYWALNVGTAVLAVMFNIGTVSFLVPLIQRGISDGPDDGLNPVRQRRQVSALLRGFGWSVIWSPTAIAPLVVASLIPGTDRTRWLVIGLVVFVLILIVGAAEDWLRFRHLRPRRPRVAAPVPWAAVGRFALACGWLFGMSVVFSRLTGGSIVTGLLISCPLMLLGWHAAQVGWAGRHRIGGRLTAVMVNLPGSAPVAVTLACSGYVGRVAADLVPAAQLASALRLDAMPDYLLLWSIPLALSGLSLFALSPIMMAVFFGSLFGALPVLPADPTLIAFAISCGWALSITFSPFATPVLLIDRVTGIAPRQLTWGWNLGFSALAAVSLLPVFVVLTGGQ
ncbi:MAG: hypothetical protein V4747_09210 [Pseudomonadota bacterium]